MPRFARASFWCAATFATVAACGSSPEPALYALAPTRGTAQAAGAHIVRIRRPGLAGYLDRPEIVRRVADFRLGVTSNERWGEPLDVMLGRVIAQDIEQRLPGTSVYTEDGAITADPDATVEVDVRRLDIGNDGDAHLAAEVAVERGDGHVGGAAHPVTLSQSPKATTTSALVETLSDLLGQLADQIAATLRSG